MLIVRVQLPNSTIVAVLKIRQVGPTKRKGIYHYEAVASTSYFGLLYPEIRVKVVHHREKHHAWELVEKVLKKVNLKLADMPRPVFGDKQNPIL